MYQAVTSDNISYSVGENALENDELRRAAHQNDLWFHLHNLPSAHAILYCHNLKRVPLSSIKEVAEAVMFWSAKHLSSVRVNYCKVKYIRSGDKPGSVVLKKTPTTITVSL
ncbi:hypothetical protein GEMRC1_010386 [Eukaryota sp. GEM-RC1]